MGDEDEEHHRAFQQETSTSASAATHLYISVLKQQPGAHKDSYLSCSYTVHSNGYLQRFECKVLSLLSCRGRKVLRFVTMLKTQTFKFMGKHQ